MKSCSRCRYSVLKCVYIDYVKSAKYQKIYWEENMCCAKCGYENPRSRRIHKECELNECPDYVHPELTRIIHECNSNKLDGITYSETYDDKGNCIKLRETKTYKCDLCEKITKQDNIDYDLNNPHPKMEELTKQRKERLEHERIIAEHKDGICPKTGKKFKEIDKGTFNDRPFMSTQTWDIRCSECDYQLRYKTDNGYTSKVGFWWK